MGDDAVGDDAMGHHTSLSDISQRSISTRSHDTVRHFVGHTVAGLQADDRLIQSIQSSFAS